MKKSNRVPITHHERKILSKGRAARRVGIPKLACKYNNSRLENKHWWLAGWNEIDIELGDLV